MGKIIDRKGLEAHRVEKYRFEALDLELDAEPFDPEIFSSNSKPKAAEPADRREPAVAPSDAALRERIETLETELASLQQRVENERKEHAQQIEEARREAFEEGKEEGIRETQQTLQESMDETRIQMQKSITELQEKMHDFQLKFETLEEEIAQSALLIAERVIATETETKSAKIAENIARTLIADLKEATRITLHLNPKDAEAIRESLGKEGPVTVHEDTAVTPGGVILYSDAGNIDATLEARIKRTIALLQKES